RLDLDPCERRPEPCVPPVAGALLVLADADLRAFRLAQDLRGHDAHAGLELGSAVTSDEEYRRTEGRPLVLAKSVDEQTLAFADAVLLSGNLDDRVGHVIPRSARAHGPRKPAHDTGYGRRAASKSSIHSDMGTSSGTPSSAGACPATGSASLSASS